MEACATLTPCGLEFAFGVLSHVGSCLSVYFAWQSRGRALQRSGSAQPRAQVRRPIALQGRAPCVFFFNFVFSSGDATDACCLALFMFALTSFRTYRNISVQVNAACMSLLPSVAARAGVTFYGCFHLVLESV